MSEELNIYALSRQWFDFSFENPDKIKPNHTALYFFAIEHCNRLGWKEKFGFPTTMAMEAIGIKSYNTYKETISDLTDWGFIKMIELSKNQYSANIIALSKFNKAQYKALDKALTKHTIKHGTKQSESIVQSTVQSIDSIDIQLYNSTSIPINNITAPSAFEIALNDFLEMRKKIKKPATGRALELIIKKLDELAPNCETDQIKILEQSTMSCWQGVFELKNNYINGKSRQQKPDISKLANLTDQILANAGINFGGTNT